MQARREVRESLAAYGAPLPGERPQAHWPLETAVLEGLIGASVDPTVLRVLPVVVARNRDRLDFKLLARMARERGREAEVGMLLDLVGSAIGDPRLQGEAEAFSSNRPSQAQSTRYLPEPRGIYERELAEEHTPDVVRRWGFRMNQTLESVRSFLEKHVGRSGVPQI